jgi:hypothetical protein
MTEAGWTVCIECGMMCEAVEYHPYAACLMFKQCLNSETVRANLQAVRDDSYHQGRVAAFKEAEQRFDSMFGATDRRIDSVRDYRVDKFYTWLAQQAQEVQLTKEDNHG